MPSASLPTTLYLNCPQCHDETLHRVLHTTSGQGAKRLDCTAQCDVCSHVHHAVVPLEQPITIPIVISAQQTSRSDRLECYPDDEFAVGMEFYLGGSNYMITGIEVGPKRPNSARASEISTLWVKQYDWVRVKIAVNFGARTQSYELRARPNDEFAVGAVVRVGGQKIMVQKIKVARRTLATGTAAARSIIRMYGKAIR